MQAILAGVLSLGNVTFEPQEKDGSLKVSEGSQGWLKAAAVSHSFPVCPCDCPCVHCYWYPKKQFPGSLSCLARTSGFHLETLHMPC